MRTIPWLTLIIMALCPVLIKAQYVSKAPLIAYDNAEADPSWQWGGDRTKKWSYWTGANHILPGSSNTASMTRSSSYSRKGSYSYKARITKDPNFLAANGTHRSELTFSTPGQSPIGWRWAAVSVYLPSDFCIDQSPMTVAFDTKANPDNYNTPFRLDIRGGRIIAIRANIQSNGSVNGEIEKDLGPVVKGVWTDWVYHRNFDMGSSGYIELYKNGDLVYSFYGPNWVNGSGRSPEAYVHMGIYKWPWLDPNGNGWGTPACNNPVEVYYDEFRFGGDDASLEDFLIDQTAPRPQPVAPTVSKAIADQNLDYTTTSHAVSLSGVFADDGGVANLAYSVTGNSNTALIKSATISGNTVSLSIAADKSGTSVLKIKATDKDGLSVEDQFTVTVADYVPVAPTVAKAIPNQNVNYSTTTQTVSLTGVFADEGGVSNLTYAVSGNSNTTLVKSATISGNTLTLSIAADKSGVSVIRIKATDKDGLSVEDDFSITVADFVPAAPKIANAIADLVLPFNTSAKNISLSGVFSDDQPLSGLTYTVSANSNPAIVTAVTVSGNSLALQLATGIAGSANITVKATDADGLSVLDQFKITVEPKVEIPPFSLMINSGGNTVNFGAETWTADKNFSGGNVYSNNSAIAGTTNDVIYQDERYGNMSYAIPVPAGSYIVRLHFAEIFHTATNKRKFNVSVENGQGALTNYDIFAIAGAKTAHVEEFDKVSVTDGILNIAFTSVIDYAKISAIEIVGIEENKAPEIAAAIADQTIGIENSSKSISLASVFTDDKGAGNLKYTIAGNTNKAVIGTTTISGTNLSLGLTKTAAGKSTITIRAADEAGLFVDASFIVTVTNKAPVANAGADQTITLPVSQLVLSGSAVDSDGTVKAYTWSQVSGPTAVFSSKTIAKPTISGLTAGTYVFQLKATDNANAASTADQVTVTVKPEPGLAVSGFTLINTSTNTDFGTITEGAQINLAVLGNGLNIRANTTPVTAGRVVFQLSGPQNYNATETSAPFALFGDGEGNYNASNPPTGTYTLKATPYATATGGVAGESLTVTFTVVNQAGAGSRSIGLAEATTPLSTTDQKLRQMSDAPVITTLNAFPNPATTQVTIGYKTEKSAKLILEVLNSAGKSVQRWPEENVYPGMIYRKTMNTSQLPNGIYIYRVSSSAGEIKTGRIVIAR